MTQPPTTYISVDPRSESANINIGRLKNTGGALVGCWGPYFSNILPKTHSVTTSWCHNCWALGPKHKARNEWLKKSKHWCFVLQSKAEDSLKCHEGAKLGLKLGVIYSTKIKLLCSPFGPIPQQCRVSPDWGYSTMSQIWSKCFIKIMKFP